MKAFYNGIPVSVTSARNIVLNASQDQGHDRDETELIFASACHPDGEEQRDMLIEYGIELMVDAAPLHDGFAKWNMAL